MERGYLALYRKIQDHPFYKERREFSKLEAWIDILMEAQHSEEPEEVLIGMKVLVCNYGESLKSVLTWATRWHWTESKVRRFFKLLKKMGQIDYQSEVITTRLSVLNYSIYDPKRRASDAEVKSKRRASDEQVTTDKHDKHVKHDKKEEKKIQKKKSPKKRKKFIPPSSEDVINYFVENGYLGTAGRKAFDYYQANNWQDSRGNKVKNWKQKMIGVWFKDENKMNGNTGLFSQEDELDAVLNQRRENAYR